MLIEIFNTLGVFFDNHKWIKNAIHIDCDILNAPQCI